MMKKVWMVEGFLCAMTLVPVAAQAAGIDGVGAIATCPVLGDIKLKPALVSAGGEAGELKFKAKSSGECSGGIGDGSTIVGFKAKGAGTTADNACTNFAGASSTDVAATLKWKVSKGSEKLNPSTVTFSLQPGTTSLEQTQEFDLTGTITAGSFTGKTVTAHVVSDLTAGTLFADCSAKGIKKIEFGQIEGETNSCVNGPNLAAAITKQITTIVSDVPHLELELLTVTASPFQLSSPVFATSNTGMQLESTESYCTQDAAPSGTWRCRHTAYYVSTGACEWDGDYTLDLSYSCNPTNTCDLCEGTETIPFSLDTEFFCE